MSFCKLGKQGALAIGLQLDERYHGRQLPGKLKMAVPGCHLNCAESFVCDIGLAGKADGSVLTIAGNLGATPRIGQELVSSLPEEETLESIAKTIRYCQENAEKGERLGSIIDRIGNQAFHAFVSA